MNFHHPARVLPTTTLDTLSRFSLGNVAVATGCAVLTLPTMYQVATETWSTDQGGHGPIVLATGLWALWRELKGKTIGGGGGNTLIAGIVLAFTLCLFVILRITGILEIEGFAMYGALIAGAYWVFGGTVMRTAWFPIVYLGFALPPPDSVVAAVTQPIKIAISSWAVLVLDFLGYPVANTGVTIQIGQYQVLVAAACAGLNSIVTLSALCLFYVYLRHRSNFLAFVVVALAAIPVAIVSNFVRVLVLVLITYYFGEAAAQGFLHEAAGLLMFSVALLTVLGVDRLASPLFREQKKLVQG